MLTLERSTSKVLQSEQQKDSSLVVHMVQPLERLVEVAYSVALVLLLEQSLVQHLVYFLRVECITTSPITD
jgi:hypothetical protein